jgi:iron complex transport system substrate-binding protein
MKRFTSIAALTAILLTTAACGDDSSSTDTAAPTTGAASDTAGPAADVPKAIISLSPTATEMLFAIGAGDQVIAVDEYSDYPAEALDKPHDLSGFEPNVDAIAALEPDLVVMQDPTIKEQLELLGITVWIGPAAVTFDDVYSQIEQLGAATGHVGEAAELVARMQADIAEAVAAVPESSTGLTYYHELDPTLYSVTSNSFIGQVYGLFGLINIADDAQPGNDYPQLNPEFIVEVDPALIFLADTKCCAESPATVAARPGWDSITAVRNGAVIGLDDDLASRWGPRIVDFIAAVSAALVAASVGA